MRIETMTTNKAPLAAAIVAAQSLAFYIDDDQEGYASRDAVVSRAKSICHEAGIAIMLRGHKTTTIDDEYWLSVWVVVIHESGQSFPKFKITVPIDDTVIEAVAQAQLVAYAQVLGLQWNEPPAPRRVKYAEPHSIVVTSEGIDVSEDWQVESGIIDKARDATRILVERFQFDNITDAYATASGIQAWPVHAQECDYMALVQLAALCGELVDRDRPIPRTHADFLIEASLLESEDFKPIFVNGVANLIKS